VGHRVILSVIPTKEHERSNTVALSQSDLMELLDAIRAGGDLDVVRTSVEMVLQALIDAEVTEVIGAEPHERTPARTNQRNGSRARLLSTKAGDVELKIPKLRQGSFFPRCSSGVAASTGRCSQS
jgi:transposase-like protein